MLSEQAHGYSPINIMTFSTQVYVKCTDRVSFSELVHPETIGLIYSVVMIFRRTVNPFFVYPSSFFFFRIYRKLVQDFIPRVNEQIATVQRYTTHLLYDTLANIRVWLKKTSKKDSFRIATLYLT